MEANACRCGSKTTLSLATARRRPWWRGTDRSTGFAYPVSIQATCFAALLGTPEHGRWLIAPVGGVRKVNRRYRPGTLVLETVFETEVGEVAVIDFMPPRSQVPELIRVVEGRRGRVPMHLELVIRFDYGSIIPWVRHLDCGLSAIAGPDRIRLRTGVELHGIDYRTVAEFAVAEGQREIFELAWHPTHLCRNLESSMFSARSRRPSNGGATGQRDARTRVNGPKRLPAR